MILTEESQNKQAEGEGRRETERETNVPVPLCPHSDFPTNILINI
jgi:hypothetical protein